MLPPKAWRFIGLNAIRALSLISLILVLASNIVVMVDDVNAVREADNAVPDPEDADLPLCDYIEGSTVPNQAGGPFWAVLNRLLILIQVIFLIFSEIGWPDALFVRILPILSAEYGVGPIGLLECLIGAQVLSHHVDPFPMVAAFLVFSIGCLNIIIALIFGKAVKSHRSIFSWRERIPRSAADLAKTAGVPSPIVNVASSVASSIFNEKDPERNSSQESFNGYGFGRQGEKAAGLKGFLLSKPADVLPKYAPRIHTSRHSSPTGSPISMPGRF